jgi:chorismate synthase
VAAAFLATVGIDVFAYTLAVADVMATTFDRGVIEHNEVRAADACAAEKMVEAILAARKKGDSVGGVIEVVARNVPAGLGEPVFDRLDADIAKALMSINAVKGVEIGEGFAAARSRGTMNNDAMRSDGAGGVTFLTNHSGGIDGGISNGNHIVARIAVKPTPSIVTPQQSVDSNGENVDMITEGRHDPCVAPRAVPVAEAMMRIVLADHILRNRAAKA